jgi:broad specificity phosphatase PhoE
MRGNSPLLTALSVQGMLCSGNRDVVVPYSLTPRSAVPFCLGGGPCRPHAGASQRREPVVQSKEVASSMRLFLVRHGATEWNQTGTYQGRLDVPLNADGRAQVAALRDRLRVEEFDICYTSALSRAIESASIIMEDRSCPVVHLADLDEMSYGRWETLTRAQIRERYPDDWTQFIADRAHFTLPGGESQVDLASRVQRALHTILVEHSQTGANVLVVAHGGSLRLIIASCLRLGDVDVRRLRLDNASLSIVDVYGDDAILSLFNDTAHLGFRKSQPDRQPIH